MNIPPPAHTSIWILLNMIMLGGLVALGLNQSFSRMTIPPGARRRWRAIVIISLFGWLAARMVLGQSGIVAPARLIPLSFLVSYSAVALALVFSPVFRQAVVSIPQEKLIGVHTVRVAGFVFLAMLDMGLLPPQFALPAGYGDIIVALTAPLVVHALNRNNPYARKLAVAWNLLGLLDFTFALATGMVFIGPHVRKLALAGHSIAYLDYVLMIPGFAVPILILAHLISLQNLRTKLRSPVFRSAAGELV
jgi:hypothetical protein